MSEQLELPDMPAGRQIIGIGYTKRVGKDTAASALVRDLGFKQFAFADELKELALLVDPIALAVPGLQNTNIGHNRLSWLVRIEGWERAKDRYPEVRKFLENLGNGVRQRFGADFWLNLVMARAQSYEKVVISDVRFCNEAAAIKAAGGKLVQLTRPGHEPSTFETELAEWDDWDLDLDNAGSVVELEQQIVAWAKQQAKAHVTAD